MRFFQITLVSFLLLFANKINGQCSENVWLNPKPSPENMNTVHMASKDTVWIGADGGLLFYTTNGGQNWNRIAHNIQGNIQWITFPERNTGYLSTVGGNQSLLYKSIDAGLTWDLIFDGYKQSLYGFVKELYFWNVDSGYAFFGTSRILVTHDGGSTWNVRNTATGGTPMFFTSRDTGYLSASSQVIFKTVNGGLNWSSITIPSLGSSERIADFFFFNSLEGYAVSSSNRVLQTSNGGITWTQLNLLSNFGRAIYFTDKDSGFILPNNSTNIIYKSTNAGVSWPAITTPSNLRKNMIRFIDNVGYIVGDGGFVLKTTNYGNSWVNQRVGSSFSFYSIIDDKSNSLYAAGTSGIMRSSNQGEKWDTVHTGGVNGVYFQTSTIGYYYGNSGLFRRTTNGGNTWNTITTTFPGQTLNHLDFVNTNLGVMVSGSGNTYKTSNGGTVWNTRTSGTTQSLQKIQFSSDSMLYVAGNRGTVLRSTNAGESWQNISIPDTFNLRTLSSPTPRCLYVAGNSSRIFVSYDSGTTWIPRNTSGYSTIRDIFFETEAVGYMLAGYNADGYVLNTLDSGKSWNMLYGNARILLTAFKQFKDELFVVGINGAIFKISNSVKRPIALDASRCDVGDLVLTASTQSNNSLHWFSHPYTPATQVGTGDSLLVSNLQQSRTFYVSCYDSASACFSQRVPVLAQVIPRKTIELEILTAKDSVCAGSTVAFHLRTNANPPYAIQWALNQQDLDTTHSIQLKNPKQGDELSLQLETQEFCVNKAITTALPKSLFIHPLPKAAFSINALFQCQNNQNFVFIDNSSSADPLLSARWFVDGKTYDDASIVPSTYNSPGPKQAALFLETLYACKDTFTQEFFVLPKANANSIIGPNSFPALSQQLFVMNNADPQSTIQWFVGKANGSSSQSSIQLVWNMEGLDTLKAMEITSEGCMGDTLIKTVQISKPLWVDKLNNPFVSIYPNPSNDFFTIQNKGNEKFHYTIYALDGKVLDSNEIKQGEQKQLTGIVMPGVYVIKVCADGIQTQHFQLIKQ
jgi:photosystem II stability/assembly factor-like uncharacterized protein